MAEQPDPSKCGLGWLFRALHSKLRPRTPEEQARWDDVRRIAEDNSREGGSIWGVVPDDIKPGLANVDDEITRRFHIDVVGRAVEEEVYARTGKRGAWTVVNTNYPGGMGKYLGELFASIPSGVRTFIASLDDSTTLIQGEGGLLVDPRSWLRASAKAWATAVKTAFSKRAYQEYAQEFARREGVKRAVNAGLQLPVLEDASEEIFAKRGLGALILKLPLFGHAQRLYDVRVSEGRLATFQRYNAKRDAYLKRKGVTLSARDLAEGDRIIADLSNVLWGWGFTPKGKLKTLSGFFFSLPLVVSNFRKWGMATMVSNDLFWKGMAYAGRTGDFYPAWVAGKAGLKLLGSSAVLTAIAYESFRRAGWEVTADPQDPNFGRARLKRGEGEFVLTYLPRWVRDPVRIYHVLKRVVYQDTFVTPTGMVYTDRKQGEKALEELLRLYLTKASPAPGLALQTFLGTRYGARFFGKKIDLDTPEGREAFWESLLPILVQEFREVSKGDAWEHPPTLTFYMLMQFFGLHGYTRPYMERGKGLKYDPLESVLSPEKGTPLAPFYEGEPEPPFPRPTAEANEEIIRKIVEADMERGWGHLLEWEPGGSKPPPRLEPE